MDRTTTRNQRRRKESFADSLTGFGNPNDAHTNPRTSVAGRLTAIIFVGVNDDGSPKDWILISCNRNILDSQYVAGLTVVVGRKIAQIASVALCGRRKPVR